MVNIISIINHIRPTTEKVYEYHKPVVDWLTGRKGSLPWMGLQIEDLRHSGC
jgi:hypothetical protein